MAKPQLLKLRALSILGIIIVVVIILFLIPHSPAYTYLKDFLLWINDIPIAYGTVTLTIIYSIAMIFCFPGTPFNLAAGFLFGVWLGAAVTVIGCDLGATLAFMVGRTLGRDWAQQRILTFFIIIHFIISCH